MTSSASYSTTEKGGRAMESYQAKKNLTQALIHLFLIVFSISMLVPFLWMVLTAFKTQAESTAIDPFVFLPSSWSFESFATVWTSYNFLYPHQSDDLYLIMCGLENCSPDKEVWDHVRIGYHLHVMVYHQIDTYLTA